MGRTEPRLRQPRHLRVVSEPALSPSASRKLLEIPQRRGGLRAISTVDALIALQGMQDPTETQKRAVAKGRSALDVLDSLKLGLLDGSVDQSTLARLKVASEGLTETSGDVGLDVVLSEIDLRVAVELAKAGIRWNSARQPGARSLKLSH